MTRETTLFTAALGLTPPWEVTDIRVRTLTPISDLSLPASSGK